MTKRLLLSVLMLCAPLWAHAQVVTWTDGSGGKASTEVKVTSDGPTLTFLQPHGTHTLSLVEAVKAMASPWFCVQARHVYPDGTVSAWFISETEGVCKLKSQFVTEQPPIVVVPPVEPPPVEPPPVVLPPIVETVEDLIKRNNDVMIKALDVCINKKQVPRTCMTTLRDALKAVK